MDQASIVRLFEALLLARTFEEKKIELAKEIGQVDIGPTSCYGQEAIPVGFCFELRRDDFILPSIRSAWAANITKGLPLGPIAAEMYGKAGGFSNGREISSHITCPELGVYGGTGVLGNNITVAAGIGLAARVRRTDQVAVCFMGDGASNREEFFTGLNFAALRRLPVVFVVENNQIAEFTPYRKFMPIDDIAQRAVAFGIPGVIVDGNDVMAVLETAREAIRRARAGEGPSLVECKTCRVRPMSEMGDPAKGLPPEVIREWQARDPVRRMQERLMHDGLLSETRLQELQRRFRQEVDEAFEFARAGGHAPLDEVFRDVYRDEAVLR
jgi:acetoin:2,6-dichlorophenolindophenol oxidoreductase subunit alpha